MSDLKEHSNHEILYRAKMNHNATTIEKLVVMQFSVFQMPKKIMLIISAVLMIIYGLIMSKKGLITSYFCLFLGCTIITGLDVRPKMNARKAIRQLNGKYPVSSYSFSQVGFRDADNRKELSYSTLKKLAYDQKYLYLYVSSKSAYMVSASSVQGIDGLNGLKNLISGESGLRWERPFTFWSFKAKDLFELLGDKDRKRRVGRRLGDSNIFRYRNY